MKGLRRVGAICALSVSVVVWGQTGRVAFNTAGGGAKAADIEAAVSLICPAGKMTRTKNGGVSGCNVCPRETDFYGDNASNWEMYAETPGHFASPQAENLLLSGTGCDSHANNFGGTFVFAVNVGKVRLVRYEQGLITDQCLKFGYADGRDGLVCRGGWFGQGEGDVYVFVVSFDAMGGSTHKNLIQSTDTTGTCALDGSQLVERSEIKDLQLARKPGEASVTGLTITATLGKVKCGQLQTKSTPNAVKTYAIEFGFDGKRFTVAEASKAALARFTAE